MKYLLGSNSAKGFYSNYKYLADKSNDEHCYIIKGSPGSGKSSFMKKIANHFEAKGIETDYIYCSGDPLSLDAIKFPSLGISFVDGTAPHTLDPEYPGVCDSIINMGECWDDTPLKKSKTDIIEKFSLYRRHYAAAYRFLSTIGNLLNDNANLVYKQFDFEKMSKYITNFENKNLKNKLAKKSQVKCRFINSVTCDGIITFADSLAQNCKNVIILNDFGMSASLLLSKIKDSAIKQGCDIDIYSNSIFPESCYSAIHIKENDICFIVSDEFFKFNYENATRINMRRFVNKDAFTPYNHKYSFNCKVIKSMFSEVVSQLKRAKEIHDEIEAYYISAMDFDKVNTLCNKHILEIEKKV